MIPTDMREFKPNVWERRFNPLLVKWWDAQQACDWDRYATSEARWKCVYEHAFAIPHHKALWRISRWSPHGVVEIGAGTGYWSHLLRLVLRPQGKGLLCFDKHPLPENPYSFSREWFPDMVQADHTVLKNCPLTDSMTLFMCWPPYDDPKDWPAEALRMFKGRTLAYVGEGVGGCTGGEAFHQELDDHWDAKETVRLPTWGTVRDELVIYQRRAR